MNLEIFYEANDCIRNLEKLGYELEQVPNVRRSANRMEAIRDYNISHPLSTNYHDFTTANSFWLFLKKDGVDVGGVCAKYTDLEKEGISDYWERTLNRQFFPDGSEQIQAQRADDVIGISGKIVYLGEIFLSKSVRGSGRQLTNITHLTFLLCLAKWPDLNHIYCFLRNEDASRAPTYGYTSTIPTTLFWPRPKDGRSNNEYIASIPRAQLMHVLKSQNREITIAA